AAEHCAQTTQAAQCTVTRELIQARHAFAQLRIITAAQLISRQPEHCAGTADRLFRSDVELRTERVEQTGRLRYCRDRCVAALIALRTRDCVGHIAQVESG